MGIVYPQNTSKKTGHLKSLYDG